MQMESFTTAKFSLKGHVMASQPAACSHNPTHLLQRSERPQKLVFSHTCLYLIDLLPPSRVCKAPVCAPAPDGFQVGCGEQPLTSSILGHPTTSRAAAAPLTHPFPQQNHLAQEEHSKPHASTQLQTPNETLPALLLGGLPQGDSAVPQGLGQTSRWSSCISIS